MGNLMRRDILAYIASLTLKFVRICGDPTAMINASEIGIDDAILAHPGPSLGSG